MALLDIPLDRITEADVRRLIVAGAAESLYIDYKQAKLSAAGVKAVRYLHGCGCFLLSGASFYYLDVIERRGSPSALLEYPLLRGKTIVTLSFSGGPACSGPDCGLQSPKHDACRARPCP